jgi:hypothetical protein
VSVHGFTYGNVGLSLGHVSTSREQWVQLLEQVVATGGRRRVEKGETFAHDSHGTLLFEIYANIPLQDISDLL